MDGVAIKGHVDTLLISPDGVETRVDGGSNTVSYACADAVARLFAGRGGGPKRIVFACGSSSLGDPFNLEDSQRSQDRATILGSDLTGYDVDIEPNPITDKSGDAYAGNVVRLRATLTTSSSTYIYGYLLEDAAGNVLAARRLSTKISKPAGYGISALWSITFT